MRQLIGQLDVLGLTRLVTTTQQNNENVVLLRVIDPIARPHIYLQFSHALLQIPILAGIARSQTLDPSLNAGAPVDIL
jgi:hypothetical protein